MKKRDLIGTLQMQLKAAQHKIDGYESGKRYQMIEESHRKSRRHYQRIIEQKNARIRELEHTLEKVWKWVEEICEDQEKEHQKVVKELMRQLSEAIERHQAEARKYDEEHAINAALRQKKYALETELEDEREKNRKLIAQIRRDYENSSKPSSLSPNHKKITNNRQKTGKRPGGQPGHQGHRRAKQEATEVKYLEAAPEIVNDPDFKKTDKIISKQLVNIKLVLEVTEFRAHIYRNSKTGETYHAPFPKNVVDDVNYGGSVKAFLYLLNNDCDTSIDKSRKFLSELTNGKLNISKGMISRLGHEFARKTEEERKETFKDMLLTPVMHTDCTNARYNGKSAYVFICADPEGNALYFAWEHKGLEGVKGTVTEDYQGTLVHDHELTFFNFGSEHQECLAHVLRYLKDSMENESDRTWNREMHALVTEMIHYRNETALHAEPDLSQISEFETRYDEILKKATDEYEYVLPSKYYREGYNLYRRMEKFKKAHLRFLYDYTIPTTNNAAERYLRNYKRKQKQAISFRSFASIEDLCDGKSVLIKIRNNDGANVFQEVAQRFDS